jgi:transcriptional regulator with XRE-family HTH domain
MGQEIRGVPEDASLSEAEDAPAIGPYLARQRRLRGISIEDLSARTKIPRRSLERLESGAFDRAADGFTRGFVRAVAGALGLDPDDAVARLLSEPAADEEQEDEHSSRQLRRAVAVGAGLALAVGVLLLAVWGIRSLWPDSEADAEVRPLYRRDAVRALADSVAETPPEAAPAPEPP